MASAAVQNLPALLEQYHATEILSAGGIVDQAGSYDADRAYQLIKAEAAKGPVTVNLPLIGATTLSAQDVDRLYQCIVQG